MKSIFVSLLCAMCFNLNSQVVIVCTGENSCAYHLNQNCPGLNNCLASVVYVDVATAQSVLYNYRSRCCICYPNSANCCSENNAQGTGAVYTGTGATAEGTGMAIAAAAVVIVTAGVFLESNEFYVHRTFSKYENFAWTKNAGFIGITSCNGRGWSFGLRRNFYKSALEYGYSTTLFNVVYQYDVGGTSGVVTMEATDDINFTYVNYIQNLTFRSLPELLKPFVGLQINYAWNINGAYGRGDKLGIGGIVGARYSLFDRLHFDVRYTITSQCRDFQLGINFTYQKVTWWKRRKSKVGK